MISNTTEQLWEQLLQSIEEGRVIPVLGPELLQLEINGQSTNLYNYLAERLALKLQLTPEHGETLNAVVCRYLAEGGAREYIYSALKSIMPPLAKLQLPESLLKLARIKPFKLFVTTCFDPLLTQALNQEREEKTESLSFFPGSKTDLPCALEKLNRSTVFHLFGKLSSAPEYVVNDEDVLEFMHALQSKTRPEILFDEMVKQNLLIIGCPLSDWLGRFFVRIGKHQRLVTSDGKTDFLASDQLQSDDKLTGFLRHFSILTKLFPLGSVEFVDELYRRWLQSHPPSVQPEKPIDDIVETDKMQDGAVFLSYASEDRSAAILIRDALEQAGIEVWFDRNPDALRVGENFDAKIKTNIYQCSLFVPIISMNTLTPRHRFFRSEWNHAQKLMERYPENKRFIIPVAIDDVPSDAPAVPELFRKLHWERMQGQVSEEFVKNIKVLYRENQLPLG